MYKMFDLMYLKIGEKRQLGELRYNEDVMLGSIALFSNGHYSILLMVYAGTTSFIMKFIY